MTSHQPQFLLTLRHGLEMPLSTPFQVSQDPIQSK